MHTLIHAMKASTGRATRRALSCLAVIAALAAAAPALAEVSAEQARLYSAMSEAERVNLLIKLCKTNRFETAAALKEQYPLEGDFAANRGRFIDGMILRGRGDFKGAVAEFRAALADDPKLAMVRIELAKTLYFMKEESSAKHHFKRLMADAPSDRDARAIKSYIDKIDAGNPFHYSVYAALAPTDNVNSATYNDKIYIDDPGLDGVDLGGGTAEKKKAAIGTAFGGNVTYAKQLSNGLTAIASGGAGAQVYTDSDFNSLSFNQSLELRHSSKGGYEAIAATTSQTVGHKEGRKYLDGLDIPSYSFGPRASFQRHLNAKDQIAASTSLEWRKQRKSGATMSVASSTEATWTHAFDESFAVTLGAGLDRVNSDYYLMSYWTGSGNVELYKELPRGITASLRGEVRRSDFDDINNLYKSEREDTKYIGTLRLAKRDFEIWGFAPLLEYSYVWNDSNQSIYQYDAHYVDFRLTKDF